MLYLVPTPIGNLADITYRAVKILSEVDVIYAEDTRTSKVLLDHYHITTPLKSYHQHNEKARSSEIVKQLIDGKNIAIISDAGTPGISDPSHIVVKEAISRSITVCPLPGATALIPALVASGFDTSMFYMVGFLPKKVKERDILLSHLSSFDIPIVIYEAPHRLEKTLAVIKESFRNADICIARELSKIYETFYRGKLEDILQSFNNIVLKGEFVIVVIPENIEIDNTSAIYQIYTAKYANEKISDASKYIAAELGVSRKYVYEMLLRFKV